MTTKLFIILNNANIMTISPEVLKNIPPQELFCIPNELKLMIASTGSVPRANMSIVKPPLKKPPVVRV